MIKPTSPVTALTVLIITGQWFAGSAFAEHRDPDATLADLKNRKAEIHHEIQTPSAGSRERVIEGYKIFLQSPLGGAMRREALRRLADQIIEQLEEKEFGTIEKNAGKAPPQGQEQQQNAPYKDATYADAIKLYEEALSSYPNAIGSEHIYYQLARAAEANGNPEKALKALESLTKEFPYSIYNEEATFRMGELAFLLRQYQKAEAAYKRLLDQANKSQYFEISQYKYAWSLFKQRKLKEALDSFYSLLDRSIEGMRMEDFLADMPTLSAGGREMVKDTLRVIALAYPELEGPKSIKEHFSGEGNGRDYEFMVYQELANLYLRQELIQEAATTYKTFIEAHPMHPQAPSFQLKAMEAFLSKKFAGLALEEKKAFGNSYGLKKDFWKIQKPELRTQMMPILRQHLGELAQHYHAIAQKTKTPESFRDAIHWYRAFLESFPADKEAPRMNFLLAELLFDQGQFADAANEYDRTAYLYPNHTNAQESGYAALLAFDKHGKTLEGDARTDWQRKSIESALRFAKNFSADPRLPAVLTKTAQEQFALKDSDGAIRSAQKVVNFRPQASAKLRYSAWLIIAHSLFDLEQYSRSEAAYQSVLTVTEANDPQRGKILERLAASIYKQGEQMRNEGKLDGAIRHFSRIAAVAPNTEIRYTADYDAAAGHIALKQWREAIGILEQFRNTAKGRELEYEISQKLAVAYQEIGDTRNAAAQLEKLASQGGSYDIQRDAVWRAGELYEKSNDIPAAIAAYTKYVDKYRDPLEANVEGQYKLAELSEHTRQPQLQKKWLESIIKTDKDINGQNDRIHYLAAKSTYDLSTPVRASFQAVALVAPFKENLQKKKTLMQDTIKAYTTASDYGIASITTATTFQIAEVYREFAQAMLTSERPKDLSSDELETYVVMLEEQAYPFEEKAIEIHEKNTVRVAQNIYDDWVKKSYARLSELLPARYNKQEIIEPLIDVLN